MIQMTTFFLLFSTFISYIYTHLIQFTTSTLHVCTKWITSFRLRLGLSTILFTSHLPARTAYSFSNRPTCPASFIHLHYITLVTPVQAQATRIVKLLILQFHPGFCHFLPSSSASSSLTPSGKVSKPQNMQNYNFWHFSLRVFNNWREDRERHEDKILFFKTILWSVTITNAWFPSWLC